MKKLLNLDHRHFNNILIFHSRWATYVGFSPRVWPSDLNVTASTLSGKHVSNSMHIFPNDFPCRLYIVVSGKCCSMLFLLDLNKKEQCMDIMTNRQYSRYTNKVWRSSTVTLTLFKKGDQKMSEDLKRMWILCQIVTVACCVALLFLFKVKHKWHIISELEQAHCSFWKVHICTQMSCADYIFFNPLFF